VKQTAIHETDATGATRRAAQQREQRRGLASNAAKSNERGVGL
jgi:hypothetical protein